MIQDTSKVPKYDRHRGGMSANLLWLCRVVMERMSGTSKRNAKYSNCQHIMQSKSSLFWKCKVNCTDAFQLRSGCPGTSGIGAQQSCQYITQSKVVSKSSSHSSLPHPRVSKTKQHWRPTECAGFCLIKQTHVSHGCSSYIRWVQ